MSPSTGREFTLQRLASSGLEEVRRVTFAEVAPSRSGRWTSAGDRVVLQPGIGGSHLRLIALDLFRAVLWPKQERNSRGPPVAFPHWPPSRVPIVTAPFRAILHVAGAGRGLLAAVEICSEKGRHAGYHLLAKVPLKFRQGNTTRIRPSMAGSMLDEFSGDAVDQGGIISLGHGVARGAALPPKI